MFLLADVRPITIVTWLLGSLFAILIASLIHGFVLMLSSVIARLPSLSLERSFGTTMLCNLVLYGFLAAIILAFFLGNQGDDPRASRLEIRFLLAPSHLILLLVASVLGHATIFSIRLVAANEPPLRFGRAACVAVIYVGLSSIVTALGVTVYSVATSPPPVPKEPQHWNGTRLE